MAEFSPSETEITSVVLSCSLTDAEAGGSTFSRKILSALPAALGKIIKLTIRGATMTVDEWKAFSALLAKMSSLTDLTFTGCNLSRDAVNAIFESKFQPSNIYSRLAIQNCGLDDNALPTLIRVMNTIIPAVIDLSENSLTASSLTLLATYIDRVNNVLELNLNRNFVDLTSAAKILTSLGNTACPIRHVGLCPKSPNISNYHPVTVQAVVGLFTRLNSRFVINLSGPAINDYLAISRIAPLIAPFPASLRRKVRLIVLGGKFTILNRTWQDVTEACGYTLDATYMHSVLPIDLTICQNDNGISFSPVFSAEIYCAYYVDNATLQQQIDKILSDGCTRNTKARFIVVGRRSPTATFSKLVAGYSQQIEVLYCIEKSNLDGVNACLISTINAALENAPHLCTFWDILATNLTTARKHQIFHSFETVYEVIRSSIEGRAYVPVESSHVDPFNESLAVANKRDNFAWANSAPANTSADRCVLVAPYKSSVNLTVLQSFITLLELSNVIGILSPVMVVIDPVDISNRIMEHVLQLIPSLYTYDRTKHFKNIKINRVEAALLWPGKYCDPIINTSTDLLVAALFSDAPGITFAPANASRANAARANVARTNPIPTQHRSILAVEPRSIAALEMHPDYSRPYAQNRAYESSSGGPIMYEIPAPVPAAPVSAAPVPAAPAAPVSAAPVSAAPVKRKASAPSTASKRIAGAAGASTDVRIISTPVDVTAKFAGWPAQKFRCLRGFREPDFSVVETFSMGIFGPAFDTVSDNPIFMLLRAYNHVAICETSLSGSQPLLTFPAAILDPFASPMDAKRRVYELTLKRGRTVFPLSARLFKQFQKAAKEKYSTAIRIYSGAVLLFIEGQPLVSVNQFLSTFGHLVTKVTIYSTFVSHPAYTLADYPLNDDSAMIEYLRSCFNTLAANIGNDATFEFIHVV